MTDIEPIEDTSIEAYKHQLENDLERTKVAMRIFERLKTEVLDKDKDIVLINNKPYIKRSGWRKIALAFKITTKIVESKKLEFEDGFAYEVIAEARDLNGRIMQDVGYCSTKESGKEGKPDYVIYHIASTRAINRAISNLVGAGEVSAEEIADTEEAKPKSNFIHSTLTLKFYVNDANISVPITSREYQELSKALKGIEGRPIVRNGTLYSVRYNAELAVKNNDAYEDAKQILEKFIKEKNPIYEHEFIKIVSEEE